ncbi:uncharacterized protein LOC111056909, partial [Nilaparvata lugens]|uniref:uncharacterized protein LOC111056909 n=1 Tax=Nilaparvata lugens TaxID=108931 RepID=UPI00193E5928
MNNSTSVMDWTYESVMSSLMRDLSSSPPTLPESVSSETQRFTCLVIEKENSPIASQELKRLSQSMRDTYMDASCESSSSDSAQTNCNSSLLNDQHLPTPLTIHPNDAGAVDGGEIADVKCFKSECYYCQITSPESIRATRLDFIQNSTKSKTTTFIGSESDKALFSNELIKLVQALKDTKITSLNLSGNDIDCDLLIDLAQYLSSTQIKTLDLSENRIGHKGFEYFNEILKETKISSLNVSKNSVGQFFACKNNSSSVEHSSECSHAKIFENSASTYLDLSHSSNSVDLKCIASILKNSKIKHLNLYRSIQSSESFGLFVRYLVDSSLTVLNLSGCKIGNNGVKILASVLKNTKIRSLDLSGNHIRCEGLNVFAPCLIDSQITYLNLSENRVDSIDGLGINSLALVLPNTKITKLDINYFSNVRNWKILSNCLAHTKITSLGFKGMVPKVYDDIKSLADGVKNSQINSIILGSNDAVKIVQLLSLCVVGSQLTSLTLSRFKINCSVMESLVIALKDSNITSIKLEHNSIKCKVMEVFVSYLVSSKVTNLHLSNGRKLGIGAVECLALSLRNTQISSLNLSSNQLDCESLKVLAPCLVGTKITNLNLEKNDVDLCMENYDDDESDYDDEDYYYYMDDYYYYYDNENDNSDDEDYDHFNDLTEGNRIDYMKEGMRSTVGVECLALAMKKSQLKSLNLCNNGLTCKSLLNIVLSLQDTKITTLNLRGNELCCNVLYLANILRNTQISSLDLGWKLEDNKMDSIHSKLSHSDSSLNLERQMRCTFASYYLSRINQVQTQKITSLTLSQSQISCCGDLKELCQFLSNSQVLSLDLSNNRINCDSIYYLAQVLQSTKIYSLNLAGNEISTNGVKHLTLNFSGSQLTKLDLSH